MRRRSYPMTVPGKRYGELTIVEFAGKSKHNKSMWKCLCSCGKSVVIVQGDIRSGRTLSCGHIRSQRARAARVKHATNIAGMTLSNGTIVEKRVGLVPIRDGGKQSMWRCVCACGARFTSTASPLMSGQRKWCSMTCTAKLEVKRLHPTRKTFLDIAGQSISIDDAAELAGMTKEAINYRMKKMGMTAEEAVLTPPRKHRVSEHEFMYCAR